jgi:molybdate transport system substrate-binding protein
VKSRLVVAIGLLALVLAACSSGAPPSLSAAASSTEPTSAQATSAPTVDLTIYGAASLKAVLARVKTAYEAAKPGTTLTISTDSSSALETKIEQSAPADVFLSADTANPQKLVDKGLAAGSLRSSPATSSPSLFPRRTRQVSRRRRISPGAESR